MEHSWGGRRFQGTGFKVPLFRGIKQIPCKNMGASSIQEATFKNWRSICCQMICRKRDVHLQVQLGNSASSRPRSQETWNCALFHSHDFSNLSYILSDLQLLHICHPPPFRFPRELFRLSPRLHHILQCKQKSLTQGTFSRKALAYNLTKQLGPHFLDCLFWVFPTWQLWRTPPSVQICKKDGDLTHQTPLGFLHLLEGTWGLSCQSVNQDNLKLAKTSWGSCSRTSDILIPSWL